MRAALVLLAAALAGCASGPPGPAPLDTRTESCRSCRMAVSEARFASQIVAPGEEPRFFDDLGCLRDHLSAAGAPPPGAVAYVADHRTRAWTRADRALYTRVPALATPMGSHVVAHADAASRDVDPAARGGSALSAAGFFGAALPGGGGR